MVLFTKDECEYIKSFYFKNEEIDSNKVKGFSKGEIRFSKTSCKYVTSYDENLINFILQKTDKIGIKSIIAVKFVKYGKGDYMAKHMDHQKYGAPQLHKTFMIQLSNPTDYDGGDLIVKGEVQSKELGNVCTINSTDLHEVTEVTRGTRYSAVLFLHNGDYQTNKTLI